MKKNRLSIAVIALSLPVLSLAAGINSSSDVAEMSNITVSASAQSGEAVSATMGTVVAEQIEQRPIGRAGEVLETVPGLIVTQHSGEGKANQYFLRGFNLDHGTDMATFIDGMPVNNRTHGHGQGYTDINFIIPEMIESLDYKKGPYYATEGDFANAGAVRIHTRSSLENNLIKLGLGQYGYQRALLATGSDDFVAAIDVSHYDGPWQVAQDQNKSSALLKYSLGDAVNGATFSLMSYQNHWTATDQLPQRYIDDGGDRYDSLDSDSGGETHRHSLSYQGWKDISGKNLASNLYLIDYGMELFSNFSYATDAVNGDEIRQHDERKTLGGALLFDVLPTERGEWQLGLDLRYDRIADTGLSDSSGRIIRERTIRHSVEEASLGLLAQNNHNWSEELRTQVGLRWDYIQAEVDNRLNNSEHDAQADMVSPKFSAVYSLSEATHIFFNYGRGFHSNDARGFAEGNLENNNEKADVFARSDGVDLGIQSQLTRSLQLAASLWWLTLESELIFVGDDGTTEISDKSERRGIEASLFWQPEAWLIVDSDLALSRARLLPDEGSEQYIPGAIERVYSLGVTVHDLAKWHGGLRLRHFGEFALNEDNSQRAEAVTMVNAQLGYKISPALNVSLEVINLLGEEGNDITYLYESQLPTETTPVEDVHLHPVEPTMVRAAVSYRF